MSKLSVHKMTGTPSGRLAICSGDVVIAEVMPNRGGDALGKPSAAEQAWAALFAAAPETKRQLAELLAAAKPFARYAGTWPASHSDDLVPTLRISDSITLADFRRLAAAVRAVKEGGA